MSAPYPWLAEAWSDLAERAARDALGHAYLLCGREGLGKFAFATSFARGLLCEERPSDGQACGSCRGCLLNASGNHPDLKLITPEEDRKSIVIDQVRELIEFFTLKSHYHGRKIGIVYPADTMNTASANALLKILEEPPATALLILVASRPALLPATIHSRCQRLNFALPSWEVRERWLREQLTSREKSPALDDLTLCGAPLEVLAQLDSSRPQLMNDVIAALRAAFEGRSNALEVARAFADVEIRRYLDTLELALQAAAQLRAGHPPPQLRLSASSQRQLQEISDKLHFDSLLSYLDQVGASRAMVQRSSGVRAAEVIENLWQGWMKSTQMENAP
jgi:DNA polymerase-3 subunit delta'